MSYRDLPTDVYHHITPHLSRKETSQLLPVFREEFQSMTSERCLEQEQEQTFRKLTGMELEDIIFEIQEKRDEIDVTIETVMIREMEENDQYKDFSIEKQALNYFYKLFSLSFGTSFYRSIIEQLVLLAILEFEEQSPESTSLVLRLKDIEYTIKNYSNNINMSFKNDMKHLPETVHIPLPSELKSAAPRTWFY